MTSLGGRDRDLGYGSGAGEWDPLGIWRISAARGGDEVLVIASANVDRRETENCHIFTADLPGVRKEDLKVQVEGGRVLEISGERVEEEEQDDDKWNRVERRRGRFLRRFRLPERADLEEVECSLNNGVLTVVVPKEAEASRRNVRLIEVA